MRPHSSADQRDVIAFLASPQTYGGAAVERCETHGALVFLAGERAYKLKRAVKFPYMDFSTPERRRDLCVAEMTVNRRTAPQLYLEVRSIVRGADGGLAFGPADVPAAGAVDWVLVMRRFDQAVLFEQLRRAGKLNPGHMRALAEEIAAFHGAAEPAPRYGGAAGIRDVLDTAVKVVESMAGRPFEPGKVDAFARLVWATLDRVGALLDRRRDLGLVRRCHGDLHLNNICLIDDRPVLFDAIEFNETFSCIDVLYDLAFLLMDLDWHGLRGFANAVLNRYLEIAQDHEGLAALPLFLACRAVIRAHIAVSTANAISDEARARRKLGDARVLLDRAIAYLEAPPPRLVVVGGLSGTGKSTVARALAPALGGAPGAVILRSDVTRKRLMGVADTARLPRSGYAPEMTTKVFATLAATAARILATGHTLVMDAVYGDPSQRAAIQDVAARAAARFDAFWLEAPPGVLETRVEARRGDASDATVAVVREQLEKIAPPAEWRKIDAARPTANIVDEIVRRLDESGVRDG
jgi:hypothetical protein